MTQELADYLTVEQDALKEYQAKRYEAWKRYTKSIPQTPPDLSYLIVMVPCRNGMMLGDSVAKVYETADHLNRLMRFSISAAGSAPWEARTALCSIVGQRLGVEKFRALFLDADVFIQNALDAANAIRVADANGWNIIAPYRQADSIKSWSVFKHRGHGEDVHVLDEELASMDDYEEVESAGLGFYYGDVYTHYQFYSNTLATEDIHFFRDNDIRPRVAKSVKLFTLKSVYI